MVKKVSNAMRLLRILKITPLLMVVTHIIKVNGESVTVPERKDAVLPCTIGMNDFLRYVEDFHLIRMDINWSGPLGSVLECSCYWFWVFDEEIRCDCPESSSNSRYSTSTALDMCTGIRGTGTYLKFIDIPLLIINTSIVDAGQYTCSVDMHYHEFTYSLTLDVVTPPNEGFPICSVKSMSQSIDMTEYTMKTLVSCESNGGNIFVTLKLVSETGLVVGLESGFGNETTVVMYEFISSKEDAGKTFTCHVIQGDIVTASCSTLPTTILEVYAFEEPKLSDALLFTCSGHNKASMTLFTWYINDVRINDTPGLFEIPTNSYILIVHTVSAVINNDHLIVVCEATNENGTASAQLTLNRTDETVTTLSRETTESKFLMDVTSPSSLQHQQSQSIRNQSNGVSIAGAFIGGVLSAVLCLTVIVIVYHWRTGKLRKIFRLVWCRNAENNNENVDEITKRQRRENGYFEKGKTLTQLDTDAEAYENVAMDAIVQKTDTCEHYTDLTQQAPVSVYEKLHDGIADRSKNSEDVYETV